MRRADLSLSVRQRKLPCVLDPALLLGHADGPALALRLTQVMEPWLTRSFWQTLDSSELLLRCVADDHARGAGASAAAISAWVAMREGTDAGSWLFRWIGDRLAESQVQDGADAGVLDRYEYLNEHLAARFDGGAAAPAPGWSRGFDPLACALDAVTLSATLDGALVLAQCPPDGSAEPWPVQALQRLELAATRLEPLPADSLFAAERVVVRDALAAAGLAPLLEQSRRRLAALHVAIGLDDGADGGEAARLDPWTRAQAWWYLL